MNYKEYFDLAHVMNEEGNFQDAVKFYTLSLLDNPNNSYAYSNRGEINMKLGNKEAAILDFYKAIEFDSLNPYALHNLATNKRELGELVEAISLYSKVIEINPPFVSMAYSNRGTAKAEYGDLIGALEDLKISIKINPNDSYAYHSLAMVKEYTGDKVGAQDDYKKAKELLKLF